jgi:hypothetical protein
MGTTVCRVEGTDKVSPRFASAAQARAHHVSSIPRQPPHTTHG